MPEPGTALVFSAHAADFVWRCGGAIALHSRMGYQVTVACLSFGERGESARLWKDGKALDQIKAIRRAEAEAAAEVLGVHRLECFDLGDYPLHLDREDKFRLVDLIREVQPRFMLSHSQHDPYNTDHMQTTQVVLECRMVAQAWGHDPGEGAGRTAALPVRAAPDRTDGLETRHLPRHHPGLGPEAGRDGTDERTGPSVGILHPRGAAARQPFQAQFRRPVGRARLPICRRIPVDLSPNRGRIVMPEAPIIGRVAIEAMLRKPWKG